MMMARESSTLQTATGYRRLRAFAVDRRLALLFVLLLILAVLNAVLVRHVLWDQRDVSETRSLLNKVGGLTQQTALHVVGIALGDAEGHAQVQAQLREVDAVLHALRVGGEIDGVVLAPLPDILQPTLQTIQARRDTLAAHARRVLQEPNGRVATDDVLSWHAALMRDVAQVWQASRLLVRGLAQQRHEAQQRVLWQMYALLLFDALVLLGAYGWMRHTLVQPLRALAMGWRRLAAGDYQVRMAPTQVDELNEVAQAFNESVERIGSLLKHTEESLWQQANYDELTGLANRYLFRHHLEGELGRAQRHATTMTVLFLDLNLFKDINDTHGHKSGDRVLRQVGKRLLACVREVDMVARLGGDEFTILLSELDDPKVIERICANIQTALAAPFDLGHAAAHLSCSIGVAVYPVHGVRADDLLHHADTAMYQAKRAGAGTTVFYGDIVAQKPDGSG